MIFSIGRFLFQGYDVIATDPAKNAEELVLAAMDEAWPTVEKHGIVPGTSKDGKTFEQELKEPITNTDFHLRNAPEREEID